VRAAHSRAARACGSAHAETARYARTHAICASLLVVLVVHFVEIEGGRRKEEEKNGCVRSVCVCACDVIALCARLMAM
jgi:hypothetical protein